MSDPYDVIVVGARCAGSPTAMLLAGKGYRVLLVDKVTFPKDTVSTLFIHQPGLAKMQEWGLLDRLRATRTPPVHKMTWDLGPVVLSGSALPVDGISEVYCPRRTVLDPVLVEGAVEAGAEVRMGFAIKELVEDDGRVVGVRGREEGGPLVEERAAIVVGADGVHSFVARTVGAEVYNERAPLTSQYYSFYSGIETDGAEITFRGASGASLFPTYDGLTLVGSGWPSSNPPEASSAGEGYLEMLRSLPHVAERVFAGQVEERVAGMANIPNFFRKAHGPGWALVGDAGYHKDPITAEGITDAFRDAERFSEAINQGLVGEMPMDDALAAAQKQRDDAVLPFYEFTLGVATFQELPPPTVELLKAVASDPNAVARFLAIAGGSLTPAEFFSEESIVRMMAAAQSSDDRSAENASIN
jgi:flavin-dependent dehydrogenase